MPAVYANVKRDLQAPHIPQYQLENTCERIVEGVPKAKRFLHESRDLLSA